MYISDIYSLDSRLVSYLDIFSLLKLTYNGRNDIDINLSSVVTVSELRWHTSKFSHAFIPNQIYHIWRILNIKSLAFPQLCISTKREVYKISHSHFDCSTGPSMNLLHLQQSYYSFSSNKRIPCFFPGYQFSCFAQSFLQSSHQSSHCSRHNGTCLNWVNLNT